MAKDNTSSENNRSTLSLDGQGENIQIPEILPLLPLHGFVFFPGMGFPLQISHAGSKHLINDALLHDRMIVMAAHKPIKSKAEHENISASSLYTIGTIGYIHKLIKGEDGILNVLISSVKKVRIIEAVPNESYLKAKIEVIDMVTEKDQEAEALVLNLRNQFFRMTELTKLPKELEMTVQALTDHFHVAYLVGSQLNLPLEKEQEILEIANCKDLVKKVTLELAKKIETLEVSSEIQKSVQDDISEKQKEYFLRNQLKAIRKKLGEEDSNVELDDLQLKVKNAKLSDEARKTAEKELNRLSRIPSSSSEYTVARTYIEWITDLPWKKKTRDSLDLRRAQKIMDADHYGLKKIKKRIIEFLAVRKLKKNMHGPILCFVGPPGVGKTSLGQSIARSVNKKFIRISLGGIRDEAEIRGHRRTYVGALPGRIIQSLKKAGSSNPLFMLDEIDKLGADFRGDPSSALLEVLDPEQNFSFEDHYLDIPFDLSKVMFITTANYIENIPGPLRDRMEIIELSSYTEDEKLMIAKQHLVAKELKAHALTKKDLVFDDSAIRTVIKSYTREAGVRNLERELGAICRVTAKNIVMKERGKAKVTADDVESFLGPVKFMPEKAARNWGPGLATGLAWTPVGGVLLFIEAAKMSGRGGLTLTGKLGDVMKESATAALTYIRSHTKEMQVKVKDFAKIDIHVHVPDGGTPKDGPSAGVAIVSSLVSLLTNRAVRNDVAMTGEITLRGEVLPVGGVKEKVLAAIRAEMKLIILPYRNEKDVLDIPDNVKEGVEFHYVKDIAEVIGLIFAKK